MAATAFALARQHSDRQLRKALEMTPAQARKVASTFDLARQYADRQLIRKAHAMTPVQALATRDAGWITPRCPECAWVYKDAINIAARLSSNPRFRPGASHVASPDCLRDRKPHCGCGRCTNRGGR